MPESHKASFEPLVQQVVSVAGDENFPNLNYKKLELSLRDIWRQKYFMKLTTKPVVDWENNATAGSVAELEIGWLINRHWRVWLMLGTRLWGEPVPTTYDQRVGVNASLVF